MIIRSKKSMKSRKIAYIVVGLIVGFYTVIIAMQMINGKGDYTDTVWDFASFLGFGLIAFLIFPSDHIQFTSDEFKFRDYRRRTVKLSEIDYIFYKDKFILLETKSANKYEISISNFSEEELNQLNSKFKELNIRELKEDESEAEEPS